MVLEDPWEQAMHKINNKSGSFNSTAAPAENRASTASNQSIAQANPKGVILSRTSQLKAVVVAIASRRHEMSRLMIANAKGECSNTTRTSSVGKLEGASGFNLQQGDHHWTS